MSSPSGRSRRSRVARLIVVSTVVVLLALVAAAVGARLVSGDGSGSGAERQTLVAAIIEFDRDASGVHPVGREPYLGGELVQYSRHTDRGRVDYYVDAETARVMRMDDFTGRRDSKAITLEDAQGIATAWASRCFKEFDSRRLQLSQRELVDHGSNTGAYYAFTWTKWDARSRALLPVTVSVRVDAATGRVFAYNSLDVPVVVSTRPAVGRQEAERVALEAAAQLCDAVPSTATLAVATNPPNDPTGRQALVWQIEVRGQSSTGLTCGAFVYIDAQSGSVLQVDLFL